MQKYCKKMIARSFEPGPYFYGSNFVTFISTLNFQVLQKPCFLKKMGFTPCKAEQPLQGMDLQEKEAQKG